MNSFKVELLEPAWRELSAIADYHLAAVGPKSAKDVTDGILNTLEKLKTFPLSSPAVPDAELSEEGYRMAIYKKYLSIYRIIGDTVFVYHIVNGKTNYPAIFK